MARNEVPCSDVRQKVERQEQPREPEATANSIFPPGGYTDSLSLTQASDRISSTQAPTSSNARIRLRGDGM